MERFQRWFLRRRRRDACSGALEVEIAHYWDRGAMRPINRGCASESRERDLRPQPWARGRTWGLGRYFMPPNGWRRYTRRRPGRARSFGTDTPSNTIASSPSLRHSSHREQERLPKRNPTTSPCRPRTPSPSTSTLRRHAACSPSPQPWGVFGTPSWAPSRCLSSCSSSRLPRLQTQKH